MILLLVVDSSDPTRSFGQAAGTFTAPFLSDTIKYVATLSLRPVTHIIFNAFIRNVIHFLSAVIKSVEKGLDFVAFP